MPSPKRKRNDTPESALRVVTQKLSNRGNYPQSVAVLRTLSKSFLPLVNQSKLKEVQNRKNRAASLIARARYLKTLRPANLTRNNLELLQYVNQMTRGNRTVAYKRNLGTNGLQKHFGARSYNSYRNMLENLRREPAPMFETWPRNPRVNERIAMSPFFPRPVNYYKSTGKRTSGRNNRTLYPAEKEYAAARFIANFWKKHRAT